MKTTAKQVQEYLHKHGTATSKQLFEALGDDVSYSTFRKHLFRMCGNGLLKNIAQPYHNAVWLRSAIQRRSGDVVPPRRYDMLRAPVLVAPEMQPSRPGASDHTLYGSKRGDVLIPHQTPMHMCSGLSGGMQ